MESPKDIAAAAAASSVPGACGTPNCGGCQTCFQFPPATNENIRNSPFDLPTKWFASSPSNNSGDSSQKSPSKSPAAGSAIPSTIGNGRRTLDEVAREIRAAAAGASTDCVRCNYYEAIFRSNHSELTRCRGEYEAIMAKARLLLQSARQDDATLHCSALCAFHQSCMVESITASSRSSSSSSLPASSSSTSSIVPLEPIPVLRSQSDLQSSQIAVATWSALDQSTFTSMYQLPAARADPAMETERPVDSSASTDMEIDSQTNANGTHPTSSHNQSDSVASSPTKKQKVNHVDNGVDQVIDPVELRALKGLSKNLEILNNESMAPATVTNVSDEGRRSGRVMRQQKENEEREKAKAKQLFEEKKRKLDLKQKEEEEAALAAFKKGKSRLANAAASASLTETKLLSNAGLCNFASLLARLSPHGLLFHKQNFQPAFIGMNRPTDTSTEHKEVIPPVHVALLGVEAASFTRSYVNFAKSLSFNPSECHSMAYHTLRLTLEQEKQQLSFTSFSQQMLAPNLLGLPPLHAAIRIGDETAVHILLDVLSWTTSTDTNANLQLSADVAQAAPVSWNVSQHAAKTPAPTASKSATSASAAPPTRIVLHKRKLSNSKVGYDVASMQYQAESKTQQRSPSKKPSSATQSATLPTIDPTSLQVDAASRQKELDALKVAMLSVRETASRFRLTPLLYAISIGVDDASTLAIIKLLVQYGASKFEQDTVGRDASIWCAMKAFPQCLQYFRKGSHQQLHADEQGNTLAHHLFAQALKEECQGCSTCLRVAVNAVEKSMPVNISSNISPSPASVNEHTTTHATSFLNSRFLKLSDLPSFFLPTILRILPLLRQAPLRSMIEQTLWKNEVRICPTIQELDLKIIEKIEEQTAAAATASSTAQATAVASRNIADIGHLYRKMMGQATAENSRQFSPFFVSLLSLWRTLLHRDSKSNANGALSSLVADLASLLPLSLFLEPIFRGQATEQITLVRVAGSRCSSNTNALEMIGHNPECIQAEAIAQKNAHGLTPKDLVAGWQSSDSHPGHLSFVRALTHALHIDRPMDNNASSSIEEKKTNKSPRCAGDYLYNSDAATQPSPAPVRSAVIARNRFEVMVIEGASTLQQPACEKCGAGLMDAAVHDPRFHSTPRCLCHLAPAFVPTPAVAARIPSGIQALTSTIEQTVYSEKDLLVANPKERYFIPVLNGLDATKPEPGRGIQHSYARCNIFSSQLLQADNLIGQANVKTPACECKNVCKGDDCRCAAQHRIGTSDPFTAAANLNENHHPVRHTVSSIFECQPLCQCKCSLGGPDITDVKRFHLRFRVQLLNHVTGWRVHTLEGIAAGSFVMEYACEVLSSEHAQLRLVEYELMANANIRNQRKLIKIHSCESTQQQQQQQSQPQSDQLRKRKQVLQLSWFDATRFGNLSSFLHDSCTGNLSFVLYYPNGMNVPKLLLFANRNIHRGEELAIVHDAKDCVKGQLSNINNIYTE